MTTHLTTTQLQMAMHWLRPDLRFIDQKHREAAERRMNGLSALLSGCSLRRAAELSNCNRRTLTLVLNKAFRPGLDGKELGFRACVPYSAFGSHKPIVIEMPQQGSAHALKQLFAINPDVEEMLKSYKGSLPPGRLPSALVSLIKRIRALLKERNYEGHWPLNCPDQGRRVFRNYIARRRFQAILEGAPTEGSSEPNLIQHINQLFTLQPFDRTEFDAHRIDVEWYILTVNAYGEYIPVRISCIWILVLIDAASTAILGWKLVVGKTYTALDVSQCFANAMRRWEPRNLIVPGLAYAPGAGMPSSIDPTIPVPMGHETLLDNAKQHSATGNLKAMVSAMYGVFSFGLPHVPQTRPFVETFFHRLELGALRQMPGGFQPRRVYQEQTKTSIWIAEKHPIHFEALEDLMDVVITGHNVSPIPARQNRTPLEIISNYLAGPDFWMPAPLSETNKKVLTTICHVVTLRGSERQDKPVRVKFLGVDYRHPDLDKAWEMIGNEYQALVDLEDLRTITLVDKTLQPIRTLTAADPWRRRRHDITTRRRILKLNRSGELEIQGAGCAIASYAEFTLRSAGNSIQVADQLARMVQDSGKPYDTPASDVSDVAAFYGRMKPLGGSTSFNDDEEFD